MTDTSEQRAEQSAVMSRVLTGLGEKVLASHSQLGDDTIIVAADQRLEVAQWLQQDSELVFDMLMDSTVVDWDEREPRFEVVDHFFSTRFFHRLRVKCAVEEDAELPSLCPLYGSALWMERESWDMYGVSFTGHPDLRRILLYPEFKGHPLRKDYDKMAAQPLFEERYSGTRETSAVHHPAPRDLDGPTS
jgi:NADH-quinone oxidoreductase subunit C